MNRKWLATLQMQLFPLTIALKQERKSENASPMIE